MGRGGAACTRVRCVATTQASTISEAATMPGVSCSPSSSAAHTSVSTGWASCTWPIWAMPPRARPAYQAKKPRNMLTSDT